MNWLRDFVRYMNRGIYTSAELQAIPFIASTFATILTGVAVTILGVTHTINPDASLNGEFFELVLVIGIPVSIIFISPVIINVMIFALNHYGNNVMPGDFKDMEMLDLDECNFARTGIAATAYGLLAATALYLPGWVAIFPITLIGLEILSRLAGKVWKLNKTLNEHINDKDAHK